ncbi:sugar ABC transporter ATP-binding protein [Dehalococcoidia bacterium]|nr:sugar ABC transporter ATP-binding protein [Dehalococcoidia bacterium]
MANPNTLEVIGLGKTFPGVVALKDVKLEVVGGRIHALVGANGAGKSTLIKILTGYYPNYEGRIKINGTPVTISRPSEAFGHGIETVHQEIDTTLVPSLSVAENLLIEELASGATGVFMHTRRLYKEARRILEGLNLPLDIDVRQRVEGLSLHKKQLLVIAKAISRKALFLILDEPTASLSCEDTEHLFKILSALRNEGVGIIYISHDLDEVKALADEVTVLRDGQKIAHFVEDFDLSQVVEAMLGAPQKEVFPPREKRELKEVVLEARHITQHGRVYNVSFQVRRGEILGITGLAGAGKTELLHLLFGDRKPDAGEILIDGRKIHFAYPGSAIRHDVYLIPEDRRRRGLILEDTVCANIALPFLKMFCIWDFIRKRLEKEHARRVITQVKLVPPDPQKKSKYLSGGNQQKVVVGKWLGRKARVIMFDEATQGIDVGSKREIYRLIHSLARDAGVIFASSDIDEVLGLADRVLVLKNGQIRAEFPADEADRQVVLEYATGVRSRQSRTREEGENVRGN